MPNMEISNADDDRRPIRIRPQTSESGSLAVTMPSEQDFNSPETGKWLE